MDSLLKNLKTLTDLIKFAGVPLAAYILVEIQVQLVNISFVLLKFAAFIETIP